MVNATANHAWNFRIAACKAHISAAAACTVYPSMSVLARRVCPCFRAQTDVPAGGHADTTALTP